MDREPRAILCLLGLAVLGHAARLAVAHPSSPPGQVLAPDGIQQDPKAQRERALRLARPLAPEERVDLNLAPAEEIARLPGIGMSLAKRIAGDRAARGPFGNLRDLDRVPGVGPALLRKLADRVAFGGGGAPGIAQDIAANPGTLGGYDAVAVVSAGGPVNLNLASQEDLMALPGIGRVRAQAVLAYRRSHGSFALLSDLERVPGFSRSLVARLSPLVVVR